MSNQPTNKQIQNAYAIAKERYATLGVSADEAMDTLAQIPISLHCWQGDDVAGFEASDAELGGGLAVTGNYPGKARNADELRRDLDKAYSLIPGTHRLNLHAMYAETGGRKTERNELRPEHFSAWIDWAKDRGHGIDFNPTCFSHPKAEGGFTLASYDDGIRAFWIEHCIACRKIGEHIGRELGTPCVTNVWIPDGFRDTPIDRQTPRMLLKSSLDMIFAEEIDPRYNLDSVESKLFGIGSESYVVGSHEFYLGYAIANDVLLCLDSFCLETHVQAIVAAGRRFRRRGLRIARAIAMRLLTIQPQPTHFSKPASPLSKQRSSWRARLITLMRPSTPAWKRRPRRNHSCCSCSMRSGVR